MIITQSSEKKVHTLMDDAYQLLQLITDEQEDIKFYPDIKGDLESLKDYLDSASELVQSITESLS